MGRGPDKLRRHVGGIFGHLHGMTLASHRRHKPRERAVMLVAGLLVAGAAAAVTLGWSMRPGPGSPPSAALLDTFLPRSIDLTIPARPEPRRFPARSTMPNCREEEASGPLRGHFHARHDLVRVDDPRVWWESDNDTGDTEDDHLMHRAMEEPFRRLVELVVAASGTLKVQDIYRESGIHAPKSLHKEGRAVDLTCDELGLERLAQLSWAAGFDWVFHEWPKKGGAHVHASVRADRPRLDPDTPIRR